MTLRNRPHIRLMARNFLLHMEVEACQDFVAVIMLMYVKLLIILCRAVGT